jgi:site-specific recombinase XerD
MRLVLRLKHMSIRTEDTYVHWVRRFILFHHKRHPQEMGAPEIRAFLAHLAFHDQVAASTQNVALNALVFLYRYVLKQAFPDLEEIERAKRPGRIPVVLAREEVSRVLAHLTGTPHLMASLLYGAGLRLMECVRLRVQDLDFAYYHITVHEAKGAKGRVTMLPHPDRAGTPGAQGRQYDDDLHTRAAARWARGTQSARSALSSVTHRPRSLSPPLKPAPGE